MTLLNQLNHIHQINEATDMTELPPDALAEIQKNIKAGAKDIEQHWANALELLHRAYEVSGVERPTPSMGNAWKAYETNLQLAVEQLAKFRGMNADWRMSSAMFREALERKLTFKVVILSNSSSKNYKVEAPSIDDIVESITARVKKTHDVKSIKVDNEDSNGVNLTFHMHKVRSPYSVQITQLT